MNTLDASIMKYLISEHDLEKFEGNEDELKKVILDKLRNSQAKKLSNDEAKALIAEKVAAAHATLAEACALAEQHKVEFSWDLAYGMGGWFGPTNDSWDSSDDDEDQEYGWMSSSSSC